MTRFGILIVLLTLGAIAQAQSPNLPPPKEPILPRAPQRADWTITLHYDREAARKRFLSPEDGKAASAEVEKPKGFFPTEIRVSKDGNIYREITVWPDGKTLEKWIAGDLQVQENPHGDIVRIMPPSGYYSSEYSDYTRSDFEALEWIRPSNYMGPRLIANQSVYTFETTGDKRLLTPREEADIRRELRERSDVSKASRTFTAHLSGGNQLPVFLDDGEVVRTYVFGPTPTDKLIPPPRFAQALEQWRKEIKRRNSVPLPP